MGFAGDAATIKAIAGLDNLGLSANSSKAEIDALITRLRQMANDPSLSDRVKKYATDLLPFIEQLGAAKTEVGTLQAAIENLPGSVTLQLKVATDGYTDTRKGQLALMPDFRDRFDQARAKRKASSTRC